ncbi:CRISPR-associated primase-polymerase type A1 [Pseudothermotoga sp. U03pept]|uniref:CRISPR-associated primase-polymerase type A1 n=1 Tax=Pseudothermotoga sp. U03pept TaxID=3447012 RepID=UPI003F0B5DC1
MDFKELALKAEENFEFAKALEYYERAYDQLSVEDGSLERYANLLLEFQHYEKAKEIFQLLADKTKRNDFYNKVAQICEALDQQNQAAELYEKIGNDEKARELKKTTKTLQIDSAVVKQFMNLFTGREDVFAVQSDEGYYPVRRPMTEKDVLEHLNGEKTLGVYVLRSDNCLKFAAFDVDLKKDALHEDWQSIFKLCKEKTVELCERLRLENIKYYVEFSGNKGFHVWIFFNRWLQAYKVRYILKKVVDELELSEKISVEVFPKQADHGGGLGNLIKLPLGVHRKTLNRCVFVGEDFEPVENQYDFLLKIEPNDSDEFEKLHRELSDQHREQQPKPSKPKATGNVKKLVRQQIKTEVDSSLFRNLLQACYPLKQIAQKIERVAYITEDEEYLLIASCGPLDNSQQFLADLLKKTINYSFSRIYSVLNRVGTVPLTCEEIKRFILSKSLPLSVDQCNCRFTTNLNTPLCLVTNCDFLLLSKIDIRDLVRKIIDKTKEKNELEYYIRNLKNLLAQKMSEEEIFIENVVIRKNKDGEIQIII